MSVWVVRLGGGGGGQGGMGGGGVEPFFSEPTCRKIMSLFLFTYFFIPSTEWDPPEGKSDPPEGNRLHGRLIVAD